MPVIKVLTIDIVIVSRNDYPSIQMDDQVKKADMIVMPEVKFVDAISFSCLWMVGRVAINNLMALEWIIFQKADAVVMDKLYTYVL